jgi:transcriptional regulator with XRE-family HTH domain
MNDTTPIDRGEIRSKLDRFGVLHKDMAEACNVSKATISAWLKGDISSPALDKAIPAFIRGIEIGLGPKHNESNVA